MIEIKCNRRFLLKSASGFCLTLPALPSLLSSAQAAELTVTPRLVSMNLNNGGLVPSNWYPGRSDFGSEIPLYEGEGHTIRESELLLTDGAISPVFDSKFAEYRSNMNFYRGLDGMFDWVHHGGWLGNFRANNVHDLTPSLKAFPTIDNVIGYTRDELLAKRVMYFTNGKWRNDHYSYSWEGSIKNPTAVDNSDAQKLDELFDTLFTGAGSGPEPELDNEKILAVDSVLESFNRVNTGQFGIASRISQEDKNKLAEHMDKIHDIERRLKEIPRACSNDIVIDNFDEVDARFIRGKSPKTIAETKTNFQVFTDLIAEAFHCDVTRVASIKANYGSFFSPTGYHDYTHQAHARAADQEIGVDYKKFAIDNLLFPLLKKLSEKTDPNGNSILENSLVCLFDESGIVSHTNDSMPVVTFGSANGYFQTGKYVDYRHPSTNYRNKTIGTLDGSYQIRHGIPWNRFLATILQSMGLEPSVWERPGQTGYGETYISGDSRSGLGSYNPPDYRDGYQYQMNDLSKNLPLITV